MADEMQALYAAMMYTYPLACIGAYFFYTQIVNPFWRTRRGQIFITRVMPSGHLRSFWAKPVLETMKREYDAPCTTALSHDFIQETEGQTPDTFKCSNCGRTAGEIKQSLREGKIKLGSEPVTAEDKAADGIRYFFKVKGEKEQLPYSDSPDYVYFQGAKKCAFYDQEGNQMSVNKMEKVITNVNPKIIDSLMTRTWNLARATAFKDTGKTLLFFIILIGLTAFTLMMCWGITQQMDGINGNIESLKVLINQTRTNVIYPQ